MSKKKKEFDKIMNNTDLIFEYSRTERIQNLKPFLEDFFDKVLGFSLGECFVSDESYLSDWEGLFDKSAKKEIIEKAKQLYNVDISEYYDLPIYEVLEIITKRFN